MTTTVSSPAAHGDGYGAKLVALVDEARKVSADTLDVLLAAARKSLDPVVAPPPPESEESVGFPEPPKGSRYARKGYNEQGWCPDRWDLGVMIYPRGTLRVLERPIECYSASQLTVAIEMLEAGYVVGFSVTDGAEIDLACSLGRRCPFPIQGVYDDAYSATAYFARCHEVPESSENAEA